MTVLFHSAVQAQFTRQVIAVKRRHRGADTVLQVAHVLDVNVERVRGQGDRERGPGGVESIARGITDRDNLAGPELLVNPNPTFEWVRLAQRIPVRIHIDDVPKSVLVSSGMTATVVMKAPPRQWAVLGALRAWRAAAP